MHSRVHQDQMRHAALSAPRGSGADVTRGQPRRRTRRAAAIATLLRGATWAVLLFAALGGRSAVAQEREMEANRLFTEARERIKAGDPEAGLELLERAEKIFAHPAIVLLQAKTQRELGLLDAADAALKRIDAAKLPKPLKKVHDDERAAVTAARSTLGRLAVTVSPADATLTLDGRQRRGGYDRWRPPGEVRLEFTAPGYQPIVRTEQVRAGETTTVDVALPALKGTIRVTVPGGLRGVDVTVDGRAAKIDDARRAGDVADLSVDLGKHEVQCMRGARRYAKAVDVAFGAVAEVRCEGIGDAGAAVLRTSLGWGGVAAGVALAAYGVVGIQGYFADVAHAEEQGLIVQSTNKHYGGALYLASGLAVGVASWLLLLRDPGSSGGEAQALAPATDASSHSLRIAH